MTLALAALVLAQVVPQREAHLLFNPVPNEWVILRLPSGELEQPHPFGNLTPTDAAVSPDGQRWAVVVQVPMGEGRLYLLDGVGGTPRHIPTPGDVADAPYFSSDGQWVYLVANDYKQPVLDARSMRYAQVYRVDFKSGQLSRLTFSKGCHLRPRPSAKGDVVYPHSNCHGLTGLQTFNISKQAERDLLPMGANVTEVAVSEDGARVFYALPGSATTELWAMEVATKNRRRWAATPITPRLRPQWDPTGTFVVVQTEGGLWRVTEDGMQPLAHQLKPL